MLNVLLIGGSYGIGEAVIKKLDDGINKIWYVSRTKNETFSSNVVHIQSDISILSSDDLSILPEFLDGFVYCPGSINLKPYNRFTETDFINDFKLNVWGAAHASQLVVPLLKKGNNAGMVFYSTVAVKSGMPFHTLVAASKGAVEGFARSLAAELAPKVRVNIIAPSLTDTPLASKLLSTDDKKVAAGQKHPLGRVGNVDDIAEATVFLISQKSSWITGQTFNVDGGMSVLKV